MKLQPESKKELVRIACGVSLCTAIMWVFFAAFHLVGWAPFNYTVILGGIAGAAVAIGNFWGICVMVQQLLDEKDETRRRMRMRLSYTSRMLIQAVWVIIAICAPCFQFIAGILPLLFPRVTIYYLQITGKYKPLEPKGEDVSAEDDEPEPELEEADTPRDERG